MTADSLDTRRRAIKIRAWRRGMREMDILIGGYVDAHLAALSEADVSDLERLMDVEDQKAFSWLCGTEEPDPEHDTAVFRNIKQFHSHSGPVNV